MAFIQITSFSIYGIFEKILTFIVQTGIFGLQQQLALNNVDAESTNCETKMTLLLGYWDDLAQSISHCQSLH